MANNISVYIDIAKLQGAHRMRLKDRNGIPQDCLVIVINQSRVKPSKTHADKLGLPLKLVPNRDGKGEYGDTHWVCEPTTKEERESSNPPRFPILGNGKEYEADATKSTRRVDPARDADPAAEGMEGVFPEGDDIPF